MSAVGTSTHPSPIPRAPLSILLAAMNLLLVLLFVLLVVASTRHFVISGSIKSFGVLAVNSLFLALFLTRRRATSETRSLKLWVLAFAGTVAPLLMRPSELASLQVGYAIQLAGLAMLSAALLSLRRSFAIVPGNRGIRQGGLYRLVRHPVYLAELTVFLGVVLANPSAYNAVIWVCECALQLARAGAEERFLAMDPLYRAYCKRVRHRLVPWLI